MNKFSESAARLRIINGLKKFIVTIEGILADKLLWNATRHDAEPFDVGAETVIRGLATQQLKAWERGDVKTANEIAEKMIPVVSAWRQAD